MKYYSTNHQTPDVTLQEAVVKGLAADKGLFMPERINTLPASFFKHMSTMSLQEVAYQVAQAFFDEDIPTDKLKQILYINNTDNGVYIIMIDRYSGSAAHYCFFFECGQ